jgi:hypothetical protein
MISLETENVKPLCSLRQNVTEGGMVHSDKNVTGGTMPNQRMAIEERYVYLNIQYDRYRRADRRTKVEMLTEMVAVTGMHRKALIRLMSSRPSRHPRKKQRSRIYGAEVEQIVRLIDRALDHPCRERLKPMLPYMADHLHALGLVHFDSETRAMLDSVSVSSVGRLLSRIRQDTHRLRRRSETTSITQIQAQVPIRNIPWDEQTPGHLEVDLVFHSGPSASGDFVYTLHMVDVATGWSECAAILGRSYRAMRDGIERCLVRLPFPVLEVHTDNGSEFLNAHLLHYWKEKYAGVFLSRTRPYHSQDNRFVEQRNGGLVRAMLGRDRLDTAQQTLQLNRFYDILWAYFNFFQPVMRQTEKTHEKGRTRRRHKDVRTPFQRSVVSGCVTPQRLAALEARFEGMNPFQLQAELSQALSVLFELPSAKSGRTEDVFETLLATTPA